MRKLSRSKAPLVVALLVAVALAGCLGQGSGQNATVSDAGAKQKPTSSEVTVDPPADANAKTGDLQVTVKDEIGTPFPGATITVVPSTVNSTLEVPAALTDANGVATFKGLPAEGYKVEATAEGYETAVQGATVVQGQVAKIELELKFIITDSAYNVTVEYSGRLTCAAGAAVLVTCSAIRDQTKTLGKEHSAEFTWVYGSAAEPPVSDKIFEAWVEATWEEPASNPWNDGKLILFDPSSRTSNQISRSGVDGDANPPARVVAPAQLMQGWGLDQGGTLGFELQPENFWSYPGFAVDWEFTAYATVFYNAPADPCYSPALKKVVLTEGCQEARAENP